MVHGKNRISYWIDRRLTGLAGPEYDVAISLGLPCEPEDCQYGESRSNSLADYLNEGFSDSWTHFRAAIAFVKRSGTRHIEGGLASFARNHDVEIIAGIDHRGTSYEGLESLLHAVSPGGRVVVFHNPTFRNISPEDLPI